MVKWYITRVKCCYANPFTTRFGCWCLHPGFTKVTHMHAFGIVSVVSLIKLSHRKIVMFNSLCIMHGSFICTSEPLLTHLHALNFALECITWVTHKTYYSLFRFLSICIINWTEFQDSMGSCICIDQLPISSCFLYLSLHTPWEMDMNNNI